MLEIEEQHEVEVSTDLGQHRVERLRLRQVAGKPVQHEPRRGIRLGEPVANQRDREVVRHELAPREERLDQPADLRVGRDRGPEHLTGRDVRDSPLVREPRRLGALAGALRPQHEQVHRRKPS